MGNITRGACAGACALALIALLLNGVPEALSAAAASVTSPFLYQFSVSGNLSEAGSMDASSSPYYWVNSGASMALKNGVGQTVQGELPIGSKWQSIYAAANPLDTDGGVHPQNIFRLVTRSRQWRNMQQEAHFQIAKYYASASPNRAEHNGILLFNRYGDGNNLYYTGIRVDGAATIKRKKNGAYCTLAYVPGIYPGTYNRVSNPNLLPLHTWIGIRSVVQTLSNGSVSIKLFVDKANNEQWTLAAEALDDGKCGSSPIDAPGSGGIRTDFMDVRFDNHKLISL